MAKTSKRGRGARYRDAQKAGPGNIRGEGVGGGNVPRSSGNFQDFLGSRNEAAARDITDLALRRGQHAAVRELGSGWNALDKGYTGGRRDLTTGYGTARGDIGGGLARSRGDITTARGQQVGATQGALGQQVGATTGARDAALQRLLASENRAVGTLGGAQTAGLQRLLNSENRAVGSLQQGEQRALGEYDVYQPGLERGAEMYSAGLGLGGPEARAQAVNAFQAGPGYDWQLEQGLGQLERRAAARGMLGSGNTSLDTMTYAQGLANQEYGNWLDRLRGQQEAGIGVAGARSGIETGTASAIGNLQMQGGVNRAGLIERTGQGISGLQSAGGINRAGVITGAGTELANEYGQAGTQLANIYGTAGSNLSNLAQQAAQQQSALASQQGTNLGNMQVGRGEASMGYHQDLANLRRDTALQQGANRAGYQLSRNQTGANQLGLAQGVLQTAIGATGATGGTPGVGTSRGANLFGFTPYGATGPATQYQNQTYR